MNIVIKLAGRALLISSSGQSSGFCCVCAGWIRNPICCCACWLLRNTWHVTAQSNLLQINMKNNDLCWIRGFLFLNSLCVHYINIESFPFLISSCQMIHYISQQVKVDFHKDPSYWFVSSDYHHSEMPRDWLETSALDCRCTRFRQTLCEITVHWRYSKANTERICKPYNGGPRWTFWLWGNSASWRQDQTGHLCLLEAVYFSSFEWDAIGETVIYISHTTILSISCLYGIHRMYMNAAGYHINVLRPIVEPIVLKGNNNAIVSMTTLCFMML